MNPLICYRIRFPDGFHVAAPGYAMEQAALTIASDTLFGAVCSAAATLFGPQKSADLLRSGMLLSSAFPFWKDQLFFPKPLSFTPKLQDATEYKKFKRVSYLSRRLFEQVLNGEHPPFNLENLLSGCWMDVPIHKKDERKTEDKREEKLWHKVDRPRVTLDRVTQASNLFTFAEIHFEPKAGLFFLARFPEDEGGWNVKKSFEAALRFLGDEGFGSDRTVGKGWFQLDEPEELTLNTPLRSNRAVLLSLLSPTHEEVEALIPDRSMYALVTRRGWVTVPGGERLRRPSQRFFGEGSVLAFKDGRIPVGATRSVLGRDRYPELPHDIYRYGRCLALPIQAVEDV